MLSLHYEHETTLFYDEPRRFVKQFSGKVRLMNADEVDETIGSFRVFVIDVEGAVNAGESVFHVFDTEQTTMDCYSLYDSELEFKPGVIRAMDAEPTWEPNMLILDRLEIYPAYRGKMYGLHILRWLELHFGMGCGIVVMKPFPLQFEGKFSRADESDEADLLALGAFTQDIKKATKQLTDYYKKLGFNRVPRTPYLVRDPRRPLPKLEECKYAWMHDY